MIALLVAGAFSLAFTLLIMPAFLRLVRRLGWGQPIRVDGPTTHQIKRGTPTMGGLVFVLGAVGGYFLGHLVGPNTPFTASGLLVVLMMVGMAAVGFVDDFTKTRRQQSLGLTGWQKVGGQVLVATVFALLALFFRDSDSGLTPATAAISAIRDVSWLDLMRLGPVVGVILYLIWINFLTVAVSNAVNVTDGLDGLATGATILALSAYIFIGFFQFKQACHNVGAARGCFQVRDPLDLTIVAVALAGSLVGFLWWNASPARVFMGDTGSLGIGGTLGALAILTHTELLLVVIGGLYCIETGSVIIQRAYFKVTHGRRIFRMSPIHHHFELKGWEQVTITIRFWILAGLFMVIGVGLFYFGWLSS
ncbi:phospho-N-acetylmuramoyl-pentapeptide-transferase [Microlunatus sp. Gsoil 973]|uniref:phospho-N-acetylmuramoyl-pentapeptide- transferase n=1 Tax=Microlunatus sp. Gsoil 973 TaxID=2672569 RepID=UPI0012B4EB49|nr:phospho-N-acetylmuramoyl-pentapeptide-transferase [Microlunatus sp. Gsoil 973]QGN32754.1 phospho-N-acetylmuramoyl-pentapeptide-transferase [Microlunatus sp. Gsoil 973]